MMIDAVSRKNECEPELLPTLNANLHDMSQPLTALLCMLEYGARMDGANEMKETMASGLEQCERLMDSVRAMQTQVLRATERESAVAMRRSL